MSLHDVTRRLLQEDPTQRMGQAYYNAVRVTEDGRVWLSMRVDGTPLDPFNNDDALPAFLTAWHEDGGV